MYFFNWKSQIGFEKLNLFRNRVLSWAPKMCFLCVCVCVCVYIYIYIYIYICMNPDRWAVTVTVTATRSQTIHFSNILQRKMNNPSQPSFTLLWEQIPISHWIPWEQIPIPHYLKVWFPKAMFCSQKRAPHTTLSSKCRIRLENGVPFT